jgi:hypothetical protein
MDVVSNTFDLKLDTEEDIQTESAAEANVEVTHGLNKENQEPEQEPAQQQEDYQ